MWNRKEDNLLIGRRKGEKLEIGINEDEGSEREKER